MEINDLYVFKAPKLLASAQKPRSRVESAEIPEFDRLPVIFKKELINGKPFLSPPGRKDSERADSTNLSNSNINDTSRIGRSVSPTSNLQLPLGLLVFDEGVSPSHLHRVIEDGGEMRRHAATKSSAFENYELKYGSGKLFYAEASA